MDNSVSISADRDKEAKKYNKLPIFSWPGWNIQFIYKFTCNIVLYF